MRRVLAVVGLALVLALAACTGLPTTGYVNPGRGPQSDDTQAFAFVPDGPQDDDVVVANGNAKVLIDSLSLVYMAGSEIDFVDNLLGQSFQIKNPNAVASCGCGTSCSI